MVSAGAAFERRWPRPKKNETQQKRGVARDVHTAWSDRNLLVLRGIADRMP